MIDLTGMVSIPYLKKAVFTGSHRGMNFLLKKISSEGGAADQIQVAVWPGPFIFSVTEEEKKTFREFEFGPEGLKKAVEWLNTYYETEFNQTKP